MKVGQLLRGKERGKNKVKRIEIGSRRGKTRERGRENTTKLSRPT